MFRGSESINIVAFLVDYVNRFQWSSFTLCIDKISFLLYTLTNLVLLSIGGPLLLSVFPY